MSIWCIVDYLIFRSKRQYLAGAVYRHVCLLLRAPKWITAWIIPIQAGVWIGMIQLLLDPVKVVNVWSADTKSEVDSLPVFAVKTWFCSVMPPQTAGHPYCNVNAQW